MANRYLSPVFKAVYDEKFCYSKFDHRMEMQKAIYLLQDMGVPVGDYGFRWYLHGPYSQSLQDDMYYEDGHDYVTINWSKDYEKKIQRLHDVINCGDRGNYSISYWVECLASLHYLRVNVLKFDASEEQIVADLEKRKPHLNDYKTNVNAYRLVEEMFR